MLAALASGHAIDRYAITLLFVASVPLLDRAIGHYALMSHWIVLWALWLCLQSRRELATAHWVAVTCLAALVHAYLLYLALALWIADVLRRRHFDPPPRPTLGDWIRHVTVVAIALIGTMALSRVLRAARPLDVRAAACTTASSPRTSTRSSIPAGDRASCRRFR